MRLVELFGLGGRGQSETCAEKRESSLEKHDGMLLPKWIFPKGCKKGFLKRVNVL